MFQEISRLLKWVVIGGILFLAIYRWDNGRLPFQTPPPAKPDAQIVKDAPLQCLALEIWHAASKESPDVQLLVGYAAVNLSKKIGSDVCAIFGNWLAMRPNGKNNPIYSRQVNFVYNLSQLDEARKAAYIRAREIAQQLLASPEPASLLPPEHKDLHCVTKFARNWQRWEVTPIWEYWALEKESAGGKPAWTSPLGTEFFCPKT